MATPTRRTYDGYIEILDRVKDIVEKELLTVEQKDSLLTKIEGFEYEIGEIISGREEEAFQGRRDE
tara:strand:+ start:4331 stop:4528 length:198 start_codon:yes stop_codon:yes gene_type:complete